MLLTKYNDELFGLNSFEQDFNKLFRNNLRNIVTDNFEPSINVRKGKFAYHVEVDLPGVNKKDIKVFHDEKNNTLTLSGERKTKKEVKEDDYYKCESSYGKFSRTFTIPDDVDAENIETDMENAVLEIRLPKIKKTETKKREIKIK